MNLEILNAKWAAKYVEKVRKGRMSYYKIALSIWTETEEIRQNGESQEKPWKKQISE